jgi:hypothetical protein
MIKKKTYVNSCYTIKLMTRVIWLKATNLKKKLKLNPQ